MPNWRPAGRRPTCSTTHGATTATAWVRGGWLELFDELSLPSSVLANSSMYGYAPSLLEAFRKRGDEIVGHGRTNAERQGTLAESEEAALIAEATAAIKHDTRASAPQGWLGPWISQSRTTPDLLHEAGYRYLLDWCMDDQPVWMRTRKGRILALPYPQELNDIPMIVGRKIGGDAFADMIVDNFDEMLEQSKAPAAGDGHRTPPLSRRPALPAAPPAPGAVSTSARSARRHLVHDRRTPSQTHAVSLPRGHRSGRLTTSWAGFAICQIHGSG